jgi:hypothetical protein
MRGACRAAEAAAVVPIAAEGGFASASSTSQKDATRFFTGGLLIRESSDGLSSLQWSCLGHPWEVKGGAKGDKGGDEPDALGEEAAAEEGESVTGEKVGVEP